MVCAMTVSVASRAPGWTPDASTFGARLALLRQAMHWGNVKEAAEACGIPPQTWRTWERDGREPHRLTTVAKQISGVTGVDWRWLALGPDDDGGEPTHRYAPGERVVAVGAGLHPTSPARAVQRTRPLAPRRPRLPAGE